MKEYSVFTAGATGTPKAWYQAWLVIAPNESEAQALIEGHPKLYDKPDTVLVGEMAMNCGLNPNQVKLWT